MAVKLIPDSVDPPPGALNPTAGPLHIPFGWRVGQNKEAGRIHAIGAGNVIVEVQQNSDTTYRVFDWNRVGLDGKARQLHIEESLKSIDFSDFEPPLQPRGAEPLVHCPYFHVEKWNITAPLETVPPGEFAIFTVLTGTVTSCGSEFKQGEFFLVPAALEDRILHPGADGASLLRTTIP